MGETEEKKLLAELAEIQLGKIPGKVVDVARDNPVRVIVEVRGGCVVGASSDRADTVVAVLDWDSVECGDKDEEDPMVQALVRQTKAMHAVW